MKFVKGILGSATAWVLLSTVLRMGSGIVLLPLVVRNFTQQDLGFWYILSAASGFSMLIDLGFSVTTMRSVASLWAGAPKLISVGQVSGSGVPNRRGIAHLYGATGYIYSWLAVFVVALYLGAVLYSSSWSVLSVRNDYLMAGICGCVSSVFIVRDAHLSAYLSGVGQMALANKIIAACQLVYLGAAVLILCSHGGLFLLSAANMGHSILRYYFTKKYVTRIIDGVSADDDSYWATKNILFVLWPMAWRYGLAALGAYFIVNANILIIGRSLGLIEVSSYGLSSQIIGVIASMASVFVNAKLPAIITYGINGDTSAFRGNFYKSYYRGVVSYILIGGLLLVLGSTVLDLVGSKATLLPPEQLAFFLFFRFLEFNHSQFAALVISQNVMPFLWAAILSGVAIVLGNQLFVLEFGVWGVLIWTATVQLMVNNWYPILVAKRYLNKALA